VEVIFTPLAERHLDSLHEYITKHASESRADEYVGRIVAFCKGLTTFLLSLLVSGGMLIPGNVPNIVCANKL